MEHANHFLNALHHRLVSLRPISSSLSFLLLLALLHYSFRYFNHVFILFLHSQVIIIIIIIIINVIVIIITTITITKFTTRYTKSRYISPLSSCRILILPMKSSTPKKENEKKNYVMIILKKTTKKKEPYFMSKFRDASLKTPLPGDSQCTSSLPNNLVILLFFFSPLLFFS